MRKKVLAASTLVLGMLLCAAPWARAATITVVSTLAEAGAAAGADTCFMQSAFQATCSASAGFGSGKSVADVLSGHLGAFVGASGPGYVSAGAEVLVNLAISDATDTDFLEVDFTLDGSFNNGGATASLYVDDGNSISTTQLACGPGQILFHGAPCFPLGVQQVLIPLSGVDNLYLTMLLQPALLYAPAYADFLNSADYKITLPEGATLINNPGGTLFQTPGAPVPEPSTGLLLGGAFVVKRLLAKRRARQS